MNQISQLTVVLSQIKHDANGKAKEEKRRFSNLNPEATEDQIKSFSHIIEQLLNIQFDKVEAIKTEELY